METAEVSRAAPRDLRAIVADGAAFSLMVGLSETYFSAFGLALGTGEVAAGLLTTIPLVLGAALQLVSPWAISRLGSHRFWVVCCAAAQATVFLPLAAAAFVGEIPTACLYLLVALYWSTGLGAGPAWNTWIGRLVPVALRARYFARRTRVCQLATLLGFLLGGVALEWGAAWGATLTAFGGLFLVASACRYVSAVCLSTQSEPACLVQQERRVAWGELLARLRHSSDGRLLFYLLAVQVAVQVSGPFFTPYMLKQLRLSYVDYVMLVSCAYLAKVVSLPVHGRFAQRYGARSLLWAGGLGIVPVAGLWVCSDRFGYLMAVQLLSGSVWAAYELAMFLLFFESIEESERTSVLTTHNLFHALSTLTGSLLGALVLSTLGKDRSAYLAVFALSSAARAAAVFLLVRVPRPVVVALPEALPDGPACPALVPVVVDAEGGEGLGVLPLGTVTGSSGYRSEEERRSAAA